MSLHKTINGDCGNCESSFLISYTEMLSSKDYPEFCPFCGEPIEDLSEDYIEDVEEDEYDEDAWH